MAEPNDTALSVLRRMAGVGRAPPEITELTPEKALRLAFGRAGKDIDGLSLRVTEVTVARLTLGLLVDAVGDQSALMTIGAGPSRVGVVAADPMTRAALIEARTIGKIGSSDPGDRPVTRIDRLILGEFLDAALGVFDEAAAELALAPAIVGFRTGEGMSGPQALALMLEDQPYRVFRVNMDFGSGARAGEVILAMPFDPPRVEVSAPGQSGANGLGDALQKVVMDTSAEVRAVLCRLNRPLADLGKLEVGQTLVIPRDSLASVVIEDIDGERLGRAKLGQINGMRALRILSAEETAGRRGEGAGQDRSRGSALGFTGAELRGATPRRAHPEQQADTGAVAPMPMADTAAKGEMDMQHQE